jgi:hypothetical protein
MKNKHVMIDIETLGTESYSSILSIAAVKFDFETGQYYEEFYKKVSLKSCLDLGMKVNADTIYWWLKKDDKSRIELTENLNELHHVLSDFSVFINEYDLVWGNSNSFDLGLLSNAYALIKRNTPWKYYNERDVRTLVSLYPQIKKETPDYGVHHNALDDCKFQINYCVALAKKLNLTL